MLVLARYEGQSIIINRNITVRVSEIRGKRVKLTIDAPKDISINRKEIEELKKLDIP